jgi:hypothetical protein
MFKKLVLVASILTAIALAPVPGAASAGPVPAGYTAAEWRADQLRSLGLDRKYHLGIYRQAAGHTPPAAWLKALRIRSDALDRKYHLGRYAIASTPTQPATGFRWADAGVGSAATLAALFAIFGTVIGMRRHRSQHAPVSRTN